MNTIVEVNPFRCCMWSLHDRLEEYLTEQAVKAELESFEKHGQLVPVLGRPLHGNPDYDIELIFGSRRLFVAKLLNMPIRIQLRSMSDREAIMAMDIENRHRQDISPYERGLSYARFLRTGQFSSQDEIAQALRISSAQVSRLLKIARLPTVIVAAFASPADICEGWGIELVNLWEDQNAKPLLARRARAIAALAERPSPQEIFRSLVTLAPLGSRRAASRDEVVKDSGGTPLFRVRPQQKWIALLIPRESCVDASLEAVKQSVANLLEEERTRTRVRSGRRITSVLMEPVQPS